VLIPGGRILFMVYNAVSYRRWLRWPISTAKHFLWAHGRLAAKPSSSEKERRAYDADSKGNAAPETTFCTKDELRGMMTGWSIEQMQLENVGDEGPLMLLPRALKLKTIGPWAGLDVYVRATRRQQCRL
jgi:hypothetical protein